MHPGGNQPLLQSSGRRADGGIRNHLEETMNLLLLLESMKFHRAKQEGAIRLLFVFCYLVNTAGYFMPGSDPNLTGILLFFTAVSEGRYAAPTVTPGNIVFIGISLAAALLTLLAVFLAAGIYAGEREGHTAGQVAKGLLRALPSLLLIGLLLVIPALLSIFLLMVPILILVTMLYFLPLNLILDRKPLTDALESSFRDTRTMKFRIFILMAMLSIVMSLPESLVFRVFPIRGLAAVLVAGFFVAARALMHGRLMGLLYLNLVKKVPIVITSKPNA